MATTRILTICLLMAPAPVKVEGHVTYEKAEMIDTEMEPVYVYETFGYNLID